MKRDERHRYDMFLRIQEFGSTHRQQFPEASPAGQAFAAVTAAVAAFKAQDSARTLAAEKDRKARASLRTMIRRRLILVARAARFVAAKTPGGSTKFPLPAEYSGAALITRARAFIHDGQAYVDELVPLGVPPTIIADLQALVDRFEEADRAWRADTAGRVAAQEALDQAIRAGLTAVRALDVVVLNTAEDDPILRASWRRARRAAPKEKRVPPGPATLATQPDTAGEAPTSAALAQAGPDDGLPKAS